MSVMDEVIGGALRDLADQARTVRPAADVIWRAGKRRRCRGLLAASAVGSAGVIVIAVVLALSAGGPGPAVRASVPASPVALRTPVLFGQVAGTSRPPCRAGTMTVRTATAPLCIRLTGTGMTIRAVRSARVQQTTPAGDLVVIRLAAADSRLLAALTRGLAGKLSPHNQLAIIAGGRVLARVSVEAPITTGRVEIVGFAARARAEALLRFLLGG